MSSKLVPYMRNESFLNIQTMNHEPSTMNHELSTMKQEKKSFLKE